MTCMKRLNTFSICIPYVMGLIESSYKSNATCISSEHHHYNLKLADKITRKKQVLQPLKNKAYNLHRDRKHSCF